MNWSQKLQEVVSACHQLRIEPHGKAAVEMEAIIFRREPSGYANRDKVLSHGRTLADAVNMMHERFRTQRLLAAREQSDE